LGLEKTEKVMFETMISADQTGDIVKGLLYEMNLGAVGNGIAMFIPVDSVGGKSSLNYFTDDLNTEKKENVMDKESKSVLIIVIVNKGNTDVVMDAARSVGAGGGTVARAKGTGAEMAKFFGVSISEEKEMVYIVAKREKRDDIMRAAMEKAGSNTESHGVIFSLPVDGVVGLKEFEGIL
jgi:nitrogen regulatory protein PII